MRNAALRGLVRLKRRTINLLSGMGFLGIPNKQKFFSLRGRVLLANGVLLLVGEALFESPRLTHHL